MRILRLTHRIRRVDCRPADVNGSDAVCRTSEPAGQTAERIPFWPVVLVNQTALRARSGGVAGINKDNQNSSQLSLVFDKGSKLVEAPSAHRAALRLSSRCACQADALEVFEGYSASAALSLPHDALADSMIEVAGHPPLLLAALLEPSLGGLGSLRLEPTTHPVIAVPETLECGTGVGLAFGVYRYVLDTEIDTDPIFGRSGRRLLYVNRGEQVELPVRKDKIRLTLPVRKKLRRPLATNERYSLPPRGTPDGYSGFVPAEDAVVVGDRPKRPEGSLRPRIKLVSVSDLSDSPNDHLGRKSRRVLDWMVSQLVELVLPERTMLPGYLADFVSRSVSGAQRVPEHVGLIRSRKKLHLYRQLHTLIVLRTLKYRKVVSMRAFLHRLKPTVSCPLFL